ncbi:DUF4093 domain-containing protein [Alicyclobacillaceae bacterium I2511]|nr:DUF4093 domain-containing protein [Alicyclobacillaceae bacterium I2511]
MRRQIPEIVVVEGIHDKQRVLEAVDAEVWVIGGDRVAHTFLAALQRAAKQRGIIILTDPDGPGERIRQRIAQSVPGCRQAFIPRVAALGAGCVGVEHATPSAVSRALQKARPEPAFCQESLDKHNATPQTAAFTLRDLVEYGLTGHPSAASRRQVVGERLGIGHGNGKTFLHKLNMLGVTRQELAAVVMEVNSQWGEQTE